MSFPNKNGIGAAVDCCMPDPKNYNYEHHVNLYTTNAPSNQPVGSESDITSEAEDPAAGGSGECWDCPGIGNCVGTVPCHKFTPYYGGSGAAHCDQVGGDDCKWEGNQCVPDQSEGHDCGLYSSCMCSGNTTGSDYCSCASNTQRRGGIIKSPRKMLRGGRALAQDEDNIQYDFSQGIEQIRRQYREIGGADADYQGKKGGRVSNNGLSKRTRPKPMGENYGLDEIL